jgi:hypothetical protein
MRGFSWPLQRALVETLRADPAVAAIAGERVLDEPLSETGLAGPAVMLGDETVTPWATATEQGAEHRVEISVVGQDHGFSRLKPLADAVCAVVLGPLPLERGRIVNVGFLAARARRDAIRHLRRIDMSFRIVIEDDADTSGE